MPMSGLFLTTKDAEQMADDLLGIWYGLMIEGREVTQEQKDRLMSYVKYFSGGEQPTDKRSDGDTYWPTKQEKN